jgi:hypothetical protein
MRSGSGKTRLALLAMAVAFLVAACASTRLVSTWRAPDHVGAPLKKIAVFVLDRDENMRRFAEDQAVRSLPGGTSGLASYRLFETPEQDIEKIKGRLARDGFDGILMARTVSVDKTKEYVPPQTITVPTGPILVGPVVNAKTLEVYYPYVWGYSYQTLPGYTAETTTIIVETVLYRLPDGEAVWSAVSETRNPQSKLEMVQEMTRLVEQQLAKEGLIGRPPGR